MSTSPPSLRLDPDDDLSDMVEQKDHSVPLPYQCDICDKVLTNLRGLKQHVIIHTARRPFACSICGKTFRFLSNCREHESVHYPLKKHFCQFCGKACRLKGNLKKHLRTHVHSSEELEAAWQPFVSNRRPRKEIDNTAIIVRGNSKLFFFPPNPNKKKYRKIWFAQNADKVVNWAKKEFVPLCSLEDQIAMCDDAISLVEGVTASRSDFIASCRIMPFERFSCSFCPGTFTSSRECFVHTEVKHFSLPQDHFCATCLRMFPDKQSFAQHESYHARVQKYLSNFSDISLLPL